MRFAHHPEGGGVRELEGIAEPSPRVRAPGGGRKKLWTASSSGVAAALGRSTTAAVTD